MDYLVYHKQNEEISSPITVKCPARRDMNLEIQTPLNISKQNINKMKFLENECKNNFKAKEELLRLHKEDMV